MEKKKKFGLERRKKKIWTFFSFFWLGHELGPISKRGPWGPAGAGLGPGKKPGTLNAARTRPVAIPILRSIYSPFM